MGATTTPFPPIARAAGDEFEQGGNRRPGQPLDFKRTNSGTPLHHLAHKCVFRNSICERAGPKLRGAARNSFNPE